MMNEDQREAVRNVFHRLSEADDAESNWTDIDEQMSMLEWLGDHQLTIEACVLSNQHSKGYPRCDKNHPISDCFVPLLIESVGYILDLYSNTGHLHFKNRFILQYYLAMSHVGFIRY